MLYELHLTAPEGVSVESWSTACEAIRAKPLNIELTGWMMTGRREQLMSAGTYECDTKHGLPLAQQTADATAKLLGSAPMDRVKLEIPLDKGIGVYDEPEYHECHVKLLLPPNDVERALEEALARGWVVSRNLLYTDINGLEKWYLTKRVYGNGALSAGSFFCDEWERTHGVLGPLARMEMETVVFDSNPTLDAGWA